MTATTNKPLVQRVGVDSPKFRKHLLARGWGPAEIVLAIRALTKQALADWKEDRTEKKVFLTVTDSEVKLRVGRHSYSWERETQKLIRIQSGHACRQPALVNLINCQSPRSKRIH